MSSCDSPSPPPAPTTTTTVTEETVTPNPYFNPGISQTTNTPPPGQFVLDAASAPTHAEVRVRDLLRLSPSKVPALHLCRYADVVVGFFEPVLDQLLGNAVSIVLRRGRDFQMTTLQRQFVPARP